jgi:hypothetical protein
MGRVYRARHLEEAWAKQQGGDVALKLMHPQVASDPGFRARFMTEAGLGRKLHHPGIVEVHEVVIDGDEMALVMSLVEGKPLTDWVRPGGMDVSECLALLLPLAEALDYLHGKGVIHRDIKPANVLVRADGQPILLDLGIAREEAGASHTRTGQTIGTTAWMAPEQADGKPTGSAADRYALGMLLYVLLTGCLPWADGLSELRVLMAKVQDELIPVGSHRADLPQALCAEVHRLLAERPADRPSAAAASIRRCQQTLVDAQAMERARRQEAEALRRREEQAEAQRMADLAEAQVMERARRQEAEALGRREEQTEAQRVADLAERQGASVEALTIARERAKDHEKRTRKRLLVVVILGWISAPLPIVGLDDAAGVVMFAALVAWALSALLDFIRVRFLAQAARNAGTHTVAFLMMLLPAMIVEGDFDVEVFLTFPIIIGIFFFVLELGVLLLKRLWRALRS